MTVGRTHDSYAKHTHLENGLVFFFFPQVLDWTVQEQAQNPTPGGWRERFTRKQGQSEVPSFSVCALDSGDRPRCGQADQLQPGATVPKALPRAYSPQQRRPPRTAVPPRFPDSR